MIRYIATIVLLLGLLGCDVRQGASPGVKGPTPLSDHQDRIEAPEINLEPGQPIPTPPPKFVELGRIKHCDITAIEYKGAVFLLASARSNASTYPVACSITPSSLDIEMMQALAKQAAEAK